MNPKLLIIRLLLDHHTWSTNRQYINPTGDRHLETLYSLLDGLHDKVDREITLDELKAVTWASKASQREKDREVFDQYFKLLEEAEIGNDILGDLLRKIKQREIAEQLAIASFDLAEDKISMDKVRDLYEKLQKTGEETTEDEFVTDNLFELLSETIEKNGLRWRLTSLNKMLGSLRQGDFGFIFARPETGKTTFLASEVTYFAEQTEQPILWINNEEGGNKVKIRLYQASLGATLEHLRKEKQRALDAFMQKTGGRIKFVDNAGINKRQIEDLCKRHQPALVVIDQIDKVKGFAGDRDDLKLGTIYQWARELSKLYCPIIGVCQADGTGEGVKWLNMGHVANAKTSKQAEADFIIGIGKTNDQGREHSRFINISKNKLQGDLDTDPNRRHGFCEVIIEPEIARYKDIGT